MNESVRSNVAHCTFSSGLDRDKLYFLPLGKWLLIDGEAWVPASSWQTVGWSHCCYMSARRLRGLPTLYPSPAIKGHLRGDGVSFCVSQLCLEKCFFFFFCFVLLFDLSSCSSKLLSTSFGLWVFVWLASKSKTHQPQHLHWGFGSLQTELLQYCMHCMPPHPHTHTEPSPQLEMSCI